MIAVYALLLTIGISSKIVFGKEQNAVSRERIEHEYAVAKVLDEMPDIAHKLQETTKESGLALVEESLDKRKADFRLKVHNEMSHLKHDNAYLEKAAVEETERYIDAIRIAKAIYGVSISQDEVNQYIATNVADIVLPEKERYAKALGISLYKLDYSFDRDFYVMDTLWDKLMPVLMARYPQEDGEDSNLYLDRIKDEFYSHSLTR
ncbi:hypothetical protein [Lysinibacillus varians]|uniref:Uncharacterized protein n=1 Tax=Lysinibacillus varians TaxID=1145276 RepID=A0ABY2TFJ2_9BACI|nr:hypothetical protein [Lysinibacillus varians]AHN24118.1 hypothetical protein T479_09815 [Lysinibacillus varians]TKI67591.1 hypothetical protein FC752_00975 [Lysinibacillus varians]